MSADGETPSLALAHGSARLHLGFRASFEGVADPRRATEREEEAETDASGAACAAWLAVESRKGFLADVGVGTIDQALLAVLPAKYQSLRLLGLAERVLVVDEAHAYDAYMGRELERLLEFQAALGGCAVVLSATLPRAVRQPLATAFAKGLGREVPVLRSHDYPLVSILWRHPERPRPIPGPRLLVVSPDPAAQIRQDWFAAAFPRAAWVYRNHALLWLSALALFGRERVRVPEDVRALVEAVYNDANVEEWAPAALQRNVIKALGEAQAARSLAQTNLLSVTKGYGGDHPGWDEDTRTPTRLGEEMTTLRLARLEGDRLVSWCPDAGDPHRNWALSEIAVRKYRVPDVAAPSEGLRPLVERIMREEWTRHDADKRLLPLFEHAPGVWQGTVLDRRAEELTVTYTRTEGLRFG